MATVFIFDLDHTAIDSSHRHHTREDGSLDLARWREYSTPEMIKRDRLLPLAHAWRDMLAQGYEIGICTSRVMSSADYQYLYDNGLHFDWIVSRIEGDNRKDGIFKLSELQRAHDWEALCARGVMFDDNADVIHTLQNNGLTVLNSLAINSKLGL